MLTRGRHLLVEYHGCDAAALDDHEGIERMMVRAAEAAGAHVVGRIFHRFSPQGVSGVVVVEESHLSIHTWPEIGYAAVDFYTCGECAPPRAHEVLVEVLRPARTEQLFVDRGLPLGPRSMRVVAHHADENPSGDEEDANLEETSVRQSVVRVACEPSVGAASRVG